MVKYTTSPSAKWCVGIAVCAVVVLVALLVAILMAFPPSKRGAGDGGDYDRLPPPSSQSVLLMHNGNDNGDDASRKRRSVVTSTVFIVGGVSGGGSKKYILDLLREYDDVQWVRTRSELKRRCPLSVNDVLFLQHLLEGDIRVSDVVAVVETYKCRLFVSVHDWYWMTMSMTHVHDGYLHALAIPTATRKLFSAADLIIHPSQFTYDGFARYFDTSKFVVSPHIDLPQVTDASPNVPPIADSTIHVGVLHQLSEYKGKAFVRTLQAAFSHRRHAGHSIVFKIVGDTIPEYEESDFDNFTQRHGIHCLLLLNKWGETYSYALTKCMNTRLPMLYNNFGAFKERIPTTNTPHYFVAYDDEAEVAANPRQLLTAFTQMLDYVITNAPVPALGNNVPPAPAPAPAPAPGIPIAIPMTRPPLYDYLFDDSKFVPSIWDAIYEKVTPFCIYFPQYHTMPENDVGFYPGMTDMVNLVAMRASGRKAEVDAPDALTLGLDSLDDYDQTKPDLVRRQVELASHWGIRGFCVYYYWFTTNSVTGEHSIMERCYDLFFRETYPNFNVYFSWANENWSKNSAFVTEDSQAPHSITNTYDEASLRANVNNLTKYFQHANYYKVDNRPVFMLLHPWFMTVTELALFQRLLNDACVRLGFDGVHLSVNSMHDSKRYNFLTSPKVKHRPNYKHSRFNEYGNSHHDATKEEEQDIQTVYFNFNNAPRMHKPSKPNRVVVIKGSSNTQRKVLEYALELYRGPPRSPCAKLFLVNSWNEWGEDMAVEPGIGRGTFYLKMLKLSLLTVLH
jgi:hypothetical protein